jgi:hypothetical protein
MRRARVLPMGAVGIPRAGNQHPDIVVDTSGALVEAE